MAQLKVDLKIDKSIEQFSESSKRQLRKEWGERKTGETFPFPLRRTS